MDEKKGISSKKINVKNIKAATKALNKTSTKKTNQSKKIPIKKNAKPLIINDNINIDKNEEEQKNSITKKKLSKTTSDTKEKIKKQEKKISSKEIDKKVTAKKSETKKKKSKKQPEKTKLVLPKEWQKINQKNKELEQQDEKFISKIKYSIFEELDDKSFEKKKKEEKEQLKKSLILFTIIVATVALIIFILINYNEYVKKQLAVYDIYEIGERVKLKDDSIWYVVSDSDSKEETVKLLANGIIDINNDNELTEIDRIKYNPNNVAEYEETVVDSVGYYLINTYKTTLQEKVGKIESISLLTSKEFVKIRNKMGFGYEWADANWLSNISMYNWWIISKQNEKVYCVTPNGSYKLQSPADLNYVRPTIVIKKSQVEKIIEQKEEVNAMASLITGFFKKENNENKD